MNSAVRFLSFSGLMLVIPAATAAQSLDVSRIAARTDTMEIVGVRGRDTLAAGLLIDEIGRIERNGRPVVLRVYRSRSPLLGTRVDTLIDAAESLRPVRAASRTDRGADLVDFGGGRARGYSILANGDSVPIDVPVGADIVNASSLDLAIRASPLAANATFGFEVFLPPTRSVVRMDARVAAVDTIDGEPAWRVDANFAGSPVSFWIGRESRRLVRQVMTVQPGFQLLFRRPRGAGAPARRAS
ncbi:MAG: hypothetical protein AB7L66_13975 [Gemmatimonadales bacterium]